MGRFSEPGKPFDLSRAGACLVSLARACALVALSIPAWGRPQEERKHKNPIVDKITSGPSREAFSGTVKSLDLGRKLLIVGTVEGSTSEIFPVTKSVRVTTASGGRLRLNSLKPGTNILVNYEQKGDERTVKEIIVLVGAPSESKKPSRPS